MGEPVQQQHQLFLNGQVPLTSKMNEMNMIEVPVIWPKVEQVTTLQKGPRGGKLGKKPKVLKKRSELSAEQLERRREATRLRIRRLRSLRTPEQAARDREATMLRMRRLRLKQKEEAAQQRELAARLENGMENFRCKIESGEDAHLQRLAYGEQCVKSELQTDGCYESKEYREENTEPVFNGSVIVNGYHHLHAHHPEPVTFTNNHSRGRSKGPTRKIPAFEKKMKQVETMANSMILKEKLEAIKLMSSVLGRLCDSLKDGLCEDPVLNNYGTGSPQLHHGHIVANNHVGPPVHAVCETTGPGGTVLIGAIDVDHANDTRHVPFQVMNTQHETVGNDFFSGECAKYEPIVKISEDPCDTSQLHHQQQRTRSA